TGATISATTFSANTIESKGITGATISATTLTATTIIGYDNVNQSCYRTLRGDLYDTLVHDIVIDDELKIAIDAVLSPRGWYFDIFPRRQTTKFNDFISSKGIKLIDSYSNEKKKKMIEDKYTYDENLEKVAETLNNLIKTIAG
ncbi:MAG: hypothetical protein IH948_05555, partial [Bacteroidetes bacterium]|nr:hypothetical protein [Bacteroidota bacterium]